MGFVRHTKKLIFFISTRSDRFKIERNQLQASVVINLDQTPSKFVPGCNKNLTQKGNKSVLIAGSSTHLFKKHQINLVQLRIFQI